MRRRGETGRAEERSKCKQKKRGTIGVLTEAEIGGQIGSKLDGRGQREESVRAGESEAG